MEAKAQTNWNAATAARLAVLFAVAVALTAALFSGAAAAHDDGDGLTVHNQTKTLDEHDEVHTITVDKATAETEFYIDVHANNESINKTTTFEAGTVKEDLELELDPTITSDTTVTIATHAANGTELANETIMVSVVEAPVVSFTDQTHELDEHGEVHNITVDLVAANEDYYVDVHVGNKSINKTTTYDGGSAKTNLTLTLDPTLTSTQNVTVAVHATNGTELAAQTATVSVTDGSAQNGTKTLTVVSETESKTSKPESETSQTESVTSETGVDDGTAIGNPTEEPTDGGGPGFGIATALLALVGATFLVRRN